MFIIYKQRAELSLLSLLLSGVLFIITTGAIAKVTTSVDARTKLKSWFVDNGNFHFELTQRLPDQMRAFLQARKFDVRSADFIAKHCLMKTVLQHKDRQKPHTKITVDIRQWQIIVDNKVYEVKTRDYWDAIIRKKFKVNKSSLLAFTWAQYPTVNYIEPDDYNWGISSYGLPPGTRFDLKVVWNFNGKQYSEIIKRVECAPDKRKL